MVSISVKKNNIATRLASTTGILKRVTKLSDGGLNAPIVSIKPTVVSATARGAVKKKSALKQRTNATVVKSKRSEVDESSDEDAVIPGPQMLPSLQCSLLGQGLVESAVRNRSGRFWKDVSKRPSRAIRGVSTIAPVDTPKPSNWLKNKKIAEEKRSVQGLARELRKEMEEESQRRRIEEAKTRERRLSQAKDSMVVQKIRREKAMKKLSPHERKRMGIFAQHELNDMLLQRRHK